MLPLTDGTVRMSKHFVDVSPEPGSAPHGLANALGTAWSGRILQPQAQPCGVIHLHMLIEGSD